MEGILKAIQYCLRKFRDILQFSAGVEIRTVEGGLQTLTKLNTLGTRLQAIITEINSYPLTFKTVARLKTSTALELDGDAEEAEEEVIAEL